MALRVKPKEIKLKPGMSLAEYTALKLQAEQEAAAIDAAKDPVERARALAIAKEIAIEEFEAAFHFRSKETDGVAKKGPSTESELEAAERERVQKLKAERAKRTLKLIADPRYTQLYTMLGERSLLTDTKL
jgi:hypothetical protein